MKVFLVIDNGTYYDDGCFGLKSDKRNDLSLYDVYDNETSAIERAKELNRGFNKKPFTVIEREVKS